MVGLDVLRLVGCFHIVAFHTLGYPRFLLDFGALWVSFFFTVSGFVATHAKLSRLSSLADVEAEPWLPSRRQLLRRLIGVYPTYVAALLLSLGLCRLRLRCRAFQGGAVEV